MNFEKALQPILSLVAILLGLVLFITTAFAQTPQAPSISYQSRLTINQMIDSDLQAAGATITINHLGQFSYEDNSGFAGLSTNPSYDTLGDELKTLLSVGDTVVITASGANIIQNGNSFQIDINISTPPPATTAVTTSGGGGTATIIGTLEAPNDQYDTFIANLPGSTESIGLYIVYGPQLQQRTPTTYFQRNSCGTADIFDFCFQVSNIYRDDFFTIYEDLPRTIRDTVLIGPYQFSILEGDDQLATFEQRWYYIIYDWYYTRPAPDNARSQTFPSKSACQTEANLVGTNIICKEFLGTTVRHSHYFDTENECKLEAVATTGNAAAQCYSTQVRNIQITFDIPTGGVDGQFGTSPATTLIGKTSAFLKGTIDTKGVPAPISVEAFGLPRFVTDSNGNQVPNTNNQPYGSTFQIDTLNAQNDPNIHILTPQSLAQPLFTNPEDPRPFTIAFNLPATTAATIRFPETLKQDYIYYYRVFNPTYVANGQHTNLFQIQPTGDQTTQGLTYVQGWFTTGEVIVENGGEVLGGVIIDGSGDITLGNLQIEEIDGLVNCGKKDQIRYYYIIEEPATDGGLAKRSWSQFYADKAQCIAASPSGECFENTMCTYNDFIGLIDRIISYILLLIGPLAAIMFAYAGLLLVTSHENADKRTQARKIFMNTAIGIVLILLAWIAVAQFLHMLGLDPDYVLLKIGS